MSDALDYLEGVVSMGKGTTAEYQWEDILGAVDVVFAEPFSREVERVMLAILRFGGRIRLAESSELPHSMTPEDMLKSFSVQWLVRETGLTHLSEMQRVEATAVSPLLASAVRAVIRRASQAKPPMVELQVVADVRTSPKHELLTGSLGVFIGRKPEKLLPRGKPKPELAKQVFRGEYTKYEAAWALQQTTVVNDTIALDQGHAYFPGHRVRKQQAEEELALA